MSLVSSFNASMLFSEPSESRQGHYVFLIEDALRDVYCQRLLGVPG